MAISSFISDLKVELRRLATPAAGTERSFLVRASWFAANVIVLHNRLNPFCFSRRLVLSAFGAKVGRNVVLRPGMRVKFPWKLDIKDGASVGEDVWIDNIAPVTIGEKAVVSQGAYLCTGNHDWRSRSFPLTARPIHIEERAWVGAMSVVGPGVTVGRNAVVRLGSVVTKAVAPVADEDRWRA